MELNTILKELKKQYIEVGEVKKLLQDTNISDAKKDYLIILANSLGLDVKAVEKTINFAENCNEEDIVKMMRSFTTKELQYNFMIDSMIVARIYTDLFGREEKRKL